MDERGGCFEIVLPYATLEPIRDLLLQQFMGERFGRDNIWETHLAEELRETSVELEAVLGEQSMDLSEVLGLKIGSQIIFRVTADDPVQLRCGGVPLFLGRTGNRRNRIAVQHCAMRLIARLSRLSDGRRTPISWRPICRS